ncbi:MAG: 50S ribosomal protein L31e [Methanomassiliicoccales archaeon]|nr:MAG: 50S ribosomal protein L31e [Methanomassiliicoccales archaeon]
MADAAEEKQVVYTIPLRGVRTVPRTERANKAVKVIREYIIRHMKAEPEKVWIDTKVNEALWARSMQSPPSVIKVRAVRFEDGLVEVSLPEEQ